MIEAPEETVISGLQALAAYGTIATREIWKALATPENVPIFLSSLIKFSVGPALAFLLSFWTFNHQENARREKDAEKEDKEAEAVKTLLRLEIDYNLNLLWDWNTALISKKSLLTSSYSLQKTVSLNPPVFYKKAYESQMPEFPRVFSSREIAAILQFYGHIDRLCSGIEEGETTSSVTRLVGYYNKTRAFLREGNPLRPGQWDEERFSQGDYF